MTEKMTRPWQAGVVLGLGTMVSHGFGLALVPAMLPRIEDTFDSGYGVLGLAIASGLIAYALGALATSRVLHRLPTRSVLVGTYVLSGAGFLAVAASSSPTTVAISVLLLGLAAPISWTTTTHIARESVAPTAMGFVTAGASGGAALGVIVNGVLIQTSADLHSWRFSFVIAALVAGLTVAASLALFRQPVARPSAPGDVQSGLYRTALSHKAGRVVVVTSGLSGLAGFTLIAFLTATAIDEMGVGSAAAAGLFWVSGAVGLLASPVFGRLGDRVSPVFAIAVIVAAYAAALIVLASLWNYPGLVIAAIGIGILNYPVWGLVATLASQRFRPVVAVRAVSLGLIAASALGALGNAIVGPWIDATGSMRASVVILALLMSTLALSLIVLRQRGILSPSEKEVSVGPDA